MRIAFVGPPGSGKSAQAKRVARSLPYHNHSPRLSSGQLVKAEIEAGTAAGREMKGYYERVERVPDETILPLILPRLRRAGGFMLDNFPATATQARALDEELGEHGLDHVVCLEGPSDERLIGRILGGRRTSQTTGEVYHLRYDPPPEEVLDPGPFLARVDDTEGAIRAQLEAYRREADALRHHYQTRGLLTVVDARRPIHEVTGEILEAIGHPERAEFYKVLQEVRPS